MSREKSKRKDVWKLVSLLVILMYALILVYPLIRLLRESVIVEGQFSLQGFKDFFSKPYYVRSIGNSLKVSLAATAISLALGVPLAYFYQMYEIKGKSLLQVLVILCSMSAPFIGAYSWIVLLGRSGVFTKLLESIGIQVGSIYGFSGIVLVLSLQLFPLVFLYLCGALKNVDNSLLEASVNMGCSGAKMFFTVVIPLCMPTIIAASLLVFMRAFADFGTPLLIGEGYKTFPVIIYDAYFAETGGDHTFGAAVSVIGIFITAAIFLFQSWISNRHHFTMNAMHSIERKKAKGFKNVLLHIYCWAIVGLSFMPQVYVIYSSFQKTSGKLFVPGYSLESYRFAFTHLKKAIPNTFLIGIAALALVVVLAILIAYLVVRRANVANKVIDTLSMVPYIIPGSVIGIALVLSFSKRPLLLSGTAAIMVIALIIRRIPYTIRSSVAVLQQIPITIEEAAISLGASKMKTFFTITVPMMGNGIISGAILSWVTIITELSTAVILYNANTITLTLAVYTYVSRGSYGIAAAYATILTVTTILSLLLYMKLTGNKEVSL
ncbi:MAG: iron ABC transporter permease [Sphaerochaetaceae bacterium]|jgi:iron(III) transport system permease protein|nr:iron ABC transporter permease [Sphaerochaetaceae bacterium]